VTAGSHADRPSSTAGDPSWLVVIDMQQVFARPDSPWATPDFGAILPAVQRLVAAYAPRVVYTRFVAPATPAGAWVPYYEQWPFALVPGDDPLYDLVPELDASGSPVVTRSTFGKWDSELAGLLGGAPLVLSGVSTDCCVLSTALAAADAGVAVRVVADACAGVSEEDHRRALTAMSLYAPLIEIVSAADTLVQRAG
jgi:nicotinamidase-related amidase